MQNISKPIYLDNAATTFPKAPGVKEAVSEFLENIGASAGRSGHSLSIESGRILFQTRKSLADLVGLKNCKHILFTLNATMAINTLLQGFLKEGDIVNVDFTTILDGYYADASRMFIIGKTTPEKEQLVRVAKECLEIGAETAKPYSFIGDIGHAIQKHADKYHYGVVRDLCGHGVGIKFHEEPEVLHYGHKGTGMLLVPGMVFTIEPMINMGTWKVFIDAEDKYGWEVITGDEKPSAQWEHTFLMTEHGVEILTY